MKKKKLIGLELGLGSGLNLFYFILNSLPMTRDVTYTRLHSDGKNMKTQWTPPHTWTWLESSQNLITKSIADSSITLFKLSS